MEARDGTQQEEEEDDDDKKIAHCNDDDFLFWLEDSIFSFILGKIFFGC